MLKVSEFSRRQILTFVVFSAADFCVAICFSLQAPFYPQEAERKGATTAEYGLVFGIFELVCFIVSPIYGQYIHRIGPRVLLNAGIITSGISSIFFGFLDRVEGHYPFIILSFIVRIVEALGNAGFVIAAFTIIATEFSDNVATTFASLEMFFGLGMIVGPTVGGALYQLGGFTLPFLVLGITLLLASTMTYFVLPAQADKPVTSKTGARFLDVLKIPSVLLASASIVITSMSIGFLSATLEPHLREFELTPITLGLMFIIDGGMYALTTPLWGWLCDKKFNPKVVTLTGSIFLVIGFSLIGPAPYIPSPEPGSPQKLALVTIGLVIHGISLGATLVAAFTDALRTSIANGFPNNFETYGLISGLWTSTFALGSFIGPSIGGVLYDSIGFNNSTVLIVLLSIVVGIVVICFLCSDKETLRYKEKSEETSEILSRKSSCTSLANNHHSSYGGTDSANTFVDTIA